jgi:putative SOS response-associated peptidase YedK
VCKLYSITTNQAAIIALFRVINRYVGNLAPMPGVFPDYKAPIVRNRAEGRELATARCGTTNIRNVKSKRWTRWLGVENRCVVPTGQSDSLASGG